jgi:hypothetical protein
MKDHTRTKTQNPDGPSEVEQLIGRIVDHEATEQDRARFQQLADVEPSLWRRLAQAQEAHAVLSQQVRHEIGGVERIELPAPDQVTRSTSSTLAWAGWAAAIVVAAVWLVSATIGKPVEPIVKPDFSNVQQSIPEEHFVAYMRAPFVLSELNPRLLQADELSDGRIALRFLRRIEEVVFLDAEQQLPPAAKDGTLLISPGDLREQGRPSEVSDAAG